MPDSFKEFEATTLFCGRCKQATAVRKRLLLVSDATDFHATSTRPGGPALRVPAMSACAKRPGRPTSVTRSKATR